jgi:hypothetical protein
MSHLGCDKFLVDVSKPDALLDHLGALHICLSI